MKSVQLARFEQIAPLLPLRTHGADVEPLQLVLVMGVRAGSGGTDFIQSVFRQEYTGYEHSKSKTGGVCGCFGYFTGQQPNTPVSAAPLRTG